MYRVHVSFVHLSESKRKAKRFLEKFYAVAIDTPVDLEIKKLINTLPVT